MFLPIFTYFYLLRIQNCFVLIFRTIVGLQCVKQARMDKNAEISRHIFALLKTFWTVPVTAWTQSFIKLSMIFRAPIVYR